ncbi:MAG: hypothetical protein ACREGR_03220 [Minisyncoccia bacterium]
MMKTKDDLVTVKLTVTVEKKELAGVKKALLDSLFEEWCDFLAVHTMKEQGPTNAQVKEWNKAYGEIEDDA